MPQYLALIYRNEANTPPQNSPEMQKVYQAWGAYDQEIRKAGVLKDGRGLMPASTATTVRVQNGKVITTDGPFAETKEQLGGYNLFECKDLDEAVLWASKIPDASSGGSVEIRQIWQM